MFKRDNIEYNPMLQITDSSTKFRKFTLNQLECTQKPVTLQASDKNGCCISIKISIQSNDISGNLKTGVFIRLKEF